MTASTESANPGLRQVWIICQNAGSPRHGMNFRPYNIGRELLARGVGVTVVSGSTSHEYFSPPVTTARFSFEDVDGLRYCWIRTPGYRESRSLGRIGAWLSFLLGLFRLVRVRLPRPDAIIVSSPPPFPALAGAWLARRYRARFIFEVRDIWPLSLIELGKFPTRHPLIRLTQCIEDFAYARAEAVVSALPMAEGHMREHGLTEGKFVYIPNGVALFPDLTANADPVVRNQFPERRFIVGYTGKIGIAYGLDTLVDAAILLRDSPDCGILVIGTGGDLGILSSRVREEGLENIRFLPPVAKERIPAVLAAFDACYLGLRGGDLFRHGISPTKLFDYMAAGKPVIMGIDAGNDPVSEAGCGLTIPPEDPEALAAAVLDLARRPRGELEAMGAAGRRYVEANHDWRILGTAYERLLLR